MPSLLSALTPAFIPSSKYSTRTTDLPLAIVCRENKEIGTYEGGVLRPRKDVTSMIAWNENTPFTKVVPSTRNASVHSSSPDEDITVQPPTELIHTATNEPFQTNFTGSDALELHGDGDQMVNMLQAPASIDRNYQPSAPPFRYFQDQALNNHQPGYPASALFQYQPYQPQLSCDIAVSEAHRPVWNPAYHKAISPSVERANQVVEEFKLYFGDGKSMEVLLTGLQKICLLCGLCEAENPPNTSEACIAVRSKLPILLPNFPLANPYLSNRS
jgi:hypothetical protein